VQRARGLETARQCWEAFVTHGWTHDRIAKELGLTQSAVTKALARAEQLGLEVMHKSIQRHKGVQFSRLERLYVEAMDGWTRSRRGRAKGDPKFLGAARAALSDIRDLLGLDSPRLAQIHHVEPNRPHQHLTDDELRQELADMLEKAGVDAATLTPGPKSVN
jgi:DNA-binding transcriptional LysR family regulator